MSDTETTKNYDDDLKGLSEKDKQHERAWRRVLTECFDKNGILNEEKFNRVLKELETENKNSKQKSNEQLDLSL